MLNVMSSGRFKKDLKRAEKRGCDMKLLMRVVDRLAAGETLEEKYHDHVLVGDYAGMHECHILPDWLLVYQVYEDDLLLLLFRTGTHSDLF